MKDLRETTIDSQVVYDGNFLQMRRDRVRLPNGHESAREFIVHPGAATMIPIFPDERILVERQYRYPVGLTMIEMPAGKIDPGESAIQTAKRELVEETGYLAREWAFLTRLHPAIGFATEVMDLFLCRDHAQSRRGRVPRDRDRAAGLARRRVARRATHRRQDADRHVLARADVLRGVALAGVRARGVGRGSEARCFALRATRRRVPSSPAPRCREQLAGRAMRVAAVRRKGWDSNPRTLARRRFSRPVQSAALPPFLEGSGVYRARGRSIRVGDRPSGP